jgi:leucyl aminopeptidase
MNYSVTSNLAAKDATGDCLLVAVYKDGQLSAAAKSIDYASNGAISDLLAFGDFSGKAEQTHTLYSLSGVTAKRIVLVGCGDPTAFDAFALKKCVSSAAAAVHSSVASITSFLADECTSTATAAVTQTILAVADKQYKFVEHKSDKGETSSLTSVTIAFSGDVENTDTALAQAAAMANGSDLSRDLSNQPGNVCTPTYLAETALGMAKEFDALDVEILEEADMEKLGMGSFLSVGHGSDQPSKLVVFKYNGAGDDSAPVALVGKGVTFDTGGISIKPGASMDEMKFDMIGAASVTGTIQAIAKMKLPLNVIGILAAAENMPSARATKPGDIVKSMSGKTIEVLNTDAEGRLVLCDALTYVGKYKPRLVIDIATLTGACIVALGHEICALLANDQSLADEIMVSGKSIGDQAWQLPMNDEYKKLLKSEHADIGNIGGRTAGTITAACFLSHFTEDYRWAHLDIAGTAWTGKAASGRPVPLLTQFLIDQA